MEDLEGFELERILDGILEGGFDAAEIAHAFDTAFHLVEVAPLYPVGTTYEDSPIFRVFIQDRVCKFLVRKQRINSHWIPIPQFVYWVFPLKEEDIEYSKANSRITLGERKQRHQDLQRSLEASGFKYNKYAEEWQFEA